MASIGLFAHHSVAMPTLSGEMDAVAAMMKLAHVTIAFWFVAGLLGRNLAFAQARRTADVATISSLVTLAWRFEKLMVIPGFGAVFLLGLLTAWAEGLPVLGFLQGARTNWLLASIVIFLALIPLIAFVLGPRRRIFERELESAIGLGALTPGLRAGLFDPVVRWSRRAELAAMTLVGVLMVLKPF